MFKILLALHLLTAIFAVGPLVHAATTASRGLRTSDASAAAAAARVTKLYSYLSVLVVIFGMGLMSAKEDGQKVADMGDPFIWISLLLWLAAVALALVVIVPTLEQASVNITNGVGVDGLVARVAASGGIVGLIFAVIVFLMVYKPGS